MFDDATNLYSSGKDLNTLIKRFVKYLKPLLDQYDLNKLGINWSKTYFMFVTNKKIPQ